MIADSFNTRFVPLSLDRPRALMPLGNVALIDYTLDFLAASGVDEIVLFCCVFAREIQAHVANNGCDECCVAGHHPPPAHVRDGRMSIVNVVSQRSLNFGDAMREIFQCGAVRSDFILVTGDIVSNAKLTDVIAAHKSAVRIASAH